MGKKRTELTDGFVDALARLWNEQGDECLQEIAKSNPALFAKLVAELIPRKVEVSDGNDAIDGMTAEEIEEWLVHSFAKDLPAAEIFFAKVRELAASGDPIVTVLPDDPPPQSSRLAKRSRAALPVVR